MANTPPPGGGIPLAYVTPSPGHTSVPGASPQTRIVPDNASSSSAGAGVLERGPNNNVTEKQLRDKFRDFDDQAVFDEVIARCGRDEMALNFVVQFGADKACVASELTHGDIQRLLATPDLFPGDDMPIRWINIWNPGLQRDVIEAIGRQYGFSKRLTMSIWAWDAVKTKLQELKRAQQRQQQQKTQPPQQQNRPHSRIAYNRNGTQGSAGAAGVPPSSMVDLENGKVAGVAGGASRSINGDDDDDDDDDDDNGNGRGDHVNHGDSGAKPHRGLNDVFAPENLATFQMMQGNLNYTSIDQEARFVCIGANWLHRRPQAKSRKTPSLVPPKHWSWFVLCGDHTVLSFHEAAYYDTGPRPEDRDEWRKKELKSMRSNTLKVLRQLSKCGLKQDEHKFMQLTSVRQPMALGQPEDQASEAASSLFYYLFEDYSAALDILNNSRIALDDISGRILRTADWKNKEPTADIIPTLYKLNKDLRQLRHLFTNYKTLIARLLSSESDSVDDILAKDQLSSRARNRFKRLQVQLQSLMLDAISDYLDEKESLQGTYFNLTNQKDSRSTERLTRSATLLAKLSVFFLPISFMTSYFSVQIPQLTDGYTAWTYWGAFAVIASLSFLSLFFFSKVLMFLSERLDHWTDQATGWVAHKVGWDARRAKRMRDADEDE
ncbi:ADP-ribosylation factor [Niveomyces insectorum RCEF 264]|uniref:ADP-ribosylation factor n=1 Tax=Niveomyces insectorum RCEF 264 TaxID=1081102 RepID=A0A167SQ90_9HYPO|nr:ADP-ribosylation factor [Niveomyces insectorum RCEF 264]